MKKLVLLILASFLLAACTTGNSSSIGDSILEAEKEKISETLALSTEPLSIHPSNIEADRNDLSWLLIGVYNENNYPLEFRIKIFEVFGDVLVEISNKDNRLSSGDFNWFSIGNQLAPRTALVKEVSFKAKSQSGSYEYLVQIVEPAKGIEVTGVVYAQDKFTIQVN
ncbi:MAG: hypothetical protein ACI8Y7_000705 [Candidatus Woesearchaeota archaeon]|jgi:hypothetical protein